MAAERLSEGDALTGANLSLTDKWPMIDVSRLDDDASGSNSTMLTSELIIGLQMFGGLPRVKRLNSQHSVSTTACTEVTDLTMNVEAGTYQFDYRLFVQSATITVGPQFNFNFDGTSTMARWWFQYADLSATLLAAIGTAAHDTSTSTLGFQMAKAEDDMATTAAGNMGPFATTNAVQTAATTIMYQLTGLIIVTVAGNLELWHGSETATATSVEVGSSLVVVRTA